MELHVSEIDNLQNYEQIPENMPPKINVLKKASKVHFEDSQSQNQNIKPYVSGVKARMVRPNVPPPKPKISYDDILNKMGMFVAEGKLHLLDGQGSKQPLNQNQEKSPRQPLTNSHSFVNEEPNPHQNSYIYN